ncbi:MAG: MgtC/SapB family protein [Erysipelotrichales bacterium]|nr:MgtC/SapB family protein [Erysipelotrichales bacterium]
MLETLIAIWNVEFVQVTIKIFLATFIGGLIGYDRLRLGKPAGIKTHALVCLGSCIAMLVGVLSSRTYGTYPTRIGAQVVSGIGFLGAGMIIVTGENRILGLTSAASLWFVACLGLAVGSEYTYIAVVSCVCYYIITHLVNNDKFLS